MNGSEMFHELWDKIIAFLTIMIHIPSKYDIDNFSLSSIHIYYNFLRGN